MKYHLMTAALSALIASTGTVSAQDFKLSHVRPEGATVDKELRVYAEEVKQATGGDVNIELFPSSSLGDYTAVQERISVGALDMALQPAATAADRQMQISTFPYLATNWDQAKSAYGTDGPVYSAMAELFQKQDITMLAAYPVYFGGISLNRAAEHPGETTPNGIKVRVPGVKSFQLTGEALGYIPSPIPFSDAFTAIQTGVVDGIIGSGAEGYYASFRDVTKTYIPANTHFEVWYLIISNGSLAQLDDEDREALIAKSAEFQAKRWDVAPAEQTAWEQKLTEDAGTEFVALTEEQLAAMAAKVRETVWPTVLEDVGAEWGQSILDQVAD